MKKLRLKYTNLTVALRSLKVALDHYANFLKRADLSNDENHTTANMFRDSVTQRFKNCFELSWKYVALYLQEKEKIDLTVISPRSVFRSACQAKLITEQEALHANMMADDRNRTSHIYKEEIADLVVQAVPEHYLLMYALCSRFNPN